VGSSAPEQPLYADARERDMALIAEAYKARDQEDAVQWLATPQGKILSLYKASETPKPKGALLIVHAIDSPQAWPASLETLRRELPLYGWATVALPLPPAYAAVVPGRDSSSASSAPSISAAGNSQATQVDNALAASSLAAEPETPPIPRDSLISVRVEAAIAQLQKLGQFNLVILADNSSAAQALPALYQKINAATSNSDTIDGPLQALVLLNLQDQEPMTRAQLQAVFAVPMLPIMDVFFTVNQRSQEDLQRVHQAEAMRQNLKDYHQLVLPLPPAAAMAMPQSFWLGRVHGFLAAKAEGTQITQGPR
jgi:hypothetical protein